jgi:hypothetical protein
MNFDDDRQRLLTSYALTLFILGVMVGLLAILGRLAQEFQHRLVFDLTILPRAAADPRPLPLLPLIDTLDSDGSLFVMVGFLVSLITISCGGAIWFHGGQPDAPYTRIWTALGSVIAACLLISMISAAVIISEDLRLILMTVPAVLALLLFIAIVYLIVERTWGLN